MNPVAPPQAAVSSSATSSATTGTFPPPNPPAPPPSRSMPNPGMAARAAMQFNSTRPIAFYASLVFIFLRFSFIHETIAELFHVTFGLVIISMMVAYPLALLGGAIPTTLRDRRSYFWLSFLGWAVLCVPFSYWVGGSLSSLFGYFRTDFVMLFLAGGLAASWKDIRKLLLTLLLANLCNNLSALLVARGEARLGMDFGGSIANANDFAAHLLYLTPIALFHAITPGVKFVYRVIGFLVFSLSAYQIVSTASRGAMLAIFVGALFFLIRARVMQKIAAVIIVVVGLAAILTVMNKAVLDRLSSFQSAGTDITTGTEAMQSRSSREYLLNKSIEFTLRFPIFGVGPDQFANFEGGDQAKKGTKGMWYVSHNAYTQVSSETGIPGLLFYLTAMGTTFFGFNRIYREALLRQDRERSNLMLCLMLGMVCYSASIIFLSLAFRAYLPFLTGLIISITRVLYLEGYGIPGFTAAPSRRTLPLTARTAPSPATS